MRRPPLAASPIAARHGPIQPQTSRPTLLSHPLKPAPAAQKRFPTKPLATLVQPSDSPIPLTHLNSLKPPCPRPILVYIVPPAESYKQAPRHVLNRPEIKRQQRNSEHKVDDKALGKEPEQQVGRDGRQLERHVKDGGSGVGAGGQNFLHCVALASRGGGSNGDAAADVAAGRAPPPPPLMAPLPLPPAPTEVAGRGSVKNSLPPPS